jgi:hypothetical protein
MLGFASWLQLCQISVALERVHKPYLICPLDCSGMVTITAALLSCCCVLPLQRWQPRFSEHRLRSVACFTDVTITVSGCCYISGNYTVCYTQ